MEPLPELLALLGKPCSWISIRDGEKKKDFVMAVRLDGKVQTSESLFQIPGDVIGGHINNQATKHSLANNQHSIPPSQVALAPKVPMTPPPAFKDSTSKPAWTVYIKCLPKGVSADDIRADFNADGIEMEGGLTATLLFATKKMAEEAITWDLAMYHGRRIELKWSTRRCWL